MDELNRTKTQGGRTLKLEELSRPAQQAFNTEDLKDIYVYANLVGNLGLIRRTLIKRCAQWKGGHSTKLQPSLVTSSSNRSEYMPET